MNSATLEINWIIAIKIKNVHAFGKIIALFVICLPEKNRIAISRQMY